MHRLLRRSNGGYSLCEPNWLHPALEVRATAKPKLGGMFKNGTLGPPVHTGGLFLGSGPGLSPLYPQSITFEPTCSSDRQKGRRIFSSLVPVEYWMRQLQRFEYEQQLSRRAAEIFKQMTELLQLRERVRLAEYRQGHASIECSQSGGFESRRSIFQNSTVCLANVGACPVLTKFLTVDPGSDILLSPVGMVGVLA